MVPRNLLPALIASSASIVSASNLLARNETSSTGSACACSKLQSLYEDLLLMPGTTGYANESVNFWDIRSDLSPSCIFMPTAADQVVEAVRIFGNCDAQFAIRGGGHMNFPGSNNVNEGVLVGLNGLDHLQYNEAEETVEVGPGNRWVDVYAELAPYGRYAIGGRLKSIGVPGLTLVGGVSYFLNKFGFSMDNVLRYEVILGDASVVNASQTEHPDLFWALKGGANNFGIVTKFVLKTYYVPKVSSTYQVFNESQVPAFIKATCEMVENEDATLGAGAVINMSYNVTTGELTPQVFGLQEGTESPPSRFASFNEMPAVSRLYNVTEPIVWHSQFETPNQMFRIQFAHHTIKPDAEQLTYIYHQWREAITDVLDVEGLYPTFVMNLVPKTGLSVAKTNGIGNTFGLDDSQSYIWWQIATSWANEEDDLRMTAWSERLISRLHALNKKMGLSTEFIYMGDAGEFQNPFPAYGNNNLEKMLAIQRIYDPKGVFTNLNWGGFKLGWW